MVVAVATVLTVAQTGRKAASHEPSTSLPPPSTPPPKLSPRSASTAGDAVLAGPTGVSGARPGWRRRVCSSGPRARDPSPRPHTARRRTLAQHGNTRPAGGPRGWPERTNLSQRAAKSPCVETPEPVPSAPTRCQAAPRRRPVPTTQSKTLSVACGLQLDPGSMRLSPPGFTCWLLPDTMLGSNSGSRSAATALPLFCFQPALPDRCLSEPPARQPRLFELTILSMHAESSKLASQAPANTARLMGQRLLAGTAHAAPESQPPCAPSVHIQRSGHGLTAPSDFWHII